MWVRVSSPWYPVSNIPPSWMVPWCLMVRIDQFWLCFHLGAALLDHLQRACLEAAREEMEEIFHDAFPNMLIIVEKCRSMINVDQISSFTMWVNNEFTGQVHGILEGQILHILGVFRPVSSFISPTFKAMTKDWMVNACNLQNSQSKRCCCQEILRLLRDDSSVFCSSNKSI